MGRARGQASLVQDAAPARSSTEPGGNATLQAHLPNTSAPSSRSQTPVKGGRQRQATPPRPARTGPFPADFAELDDANVFDLRARFTCTEDPSTIVGVVKPRPDVPGLVQTHAIFHLNAPALRRNAKLGLQGKQSFTLEDIYTLCGTFNKAYPTISKKAHPESDNDKRNGTCRLREAGWDKLLVLQDGLKDDYGQVPKELLEYFRLDIFGNVVSYHAGPGSLCFFNMDHLFPWSRGGLTTVENLLPMAEKANGCKSNKLLTFIIKWRRAPGASIDFIMTVNRTGGSGQVKLGTRQMRTGLRSAHLQRLWQSVQAAAGTDGASAPSAIERLKIILLLPWVNLLQPGKRYWSCSLPELVQHAGLLQDDLQMMLDSFAGATVIEDEDVQEEEEEEDASNELVSGPPENEPGLQPDDQTIPAMWPSASDQSSPSDAQTQQHTLLQGLDSLLAGKGHGVFDGLHALLSTLQPGGAADPAASPTLVTLQQALKTLHAFEAQQNDTHTEMRRRELLLQEQQQALNDWSAWYKSTCLPGSTQEPNAVQHVTPPVSLPHQHPQIALEPVADPFEAAQVAVQQPVAPVVMPPRNTGQWMGGRPASNQVVPLPQPQQVQAWPEQTQHETVLVRHSLLTRIFGACCR